MHKVFVAHDPIEAHFVHDLLERAGIAAEIHGEGLFGLRPAIGIDVASLPSVWVDDGDLDNARRLLADYESSKSTKNDPTEN
jgi:hypothetical protein